MAGLLADNHRGLTAVLEALCEVLFPRHCVHTGRPMAASEFCRYLSTEGAATLEWVEAPRAGCPVGSYDGGFLARSIHLQLLEQQPRQFRRALSVFALRGAGRSLVHELKYHSGLYVLADLVRLVGECPSAKDFLAGAVLVPVPLHKTRERERGFNQSKAIADALGAAYGAASEDLLLRVRATRTQTQLDRHKREHNVEGAFTLKPAFVAVPSARYVLVDDVFTTGATLDAAAFALKEGGACSVDVFTLGHG